VKLCQNCVRTQEAAVNGNSQRSRRIGSSFGNVEEQVGSARSEDYPLRRSPPAARSGSRQSARDDSPRGSIRLLRSDRLSEHVGDSSDS